MLIPRWIKPPCRKVAVTSRHHSSSNTTATPRLAPQLNREMLVGANGETPVTTIAT